MNARQPWAPTLREDEVVEAIRAIVGAAAVRSIVLGIGDDAALWQPSRSHRSAITTDMLVEGVHFAPSLMSSYDAGWRAMAANVSDLAAMGARPVLATVALGIPSQTRLDEVCELYRGLAAGGSAAGLNIVGGDLSRSPSLTIAIAAVGEVRPSNVKTRSGGRPGAVLAVTGPLGAARAGLDVARGSLRLGTALAARALQAFRHPEARCAEGRFFGASRNVEAMMDCSDGLSTDLDRLCRASSCGAVIDDVPVAACARAAAEDAGVDPQRYALGGGEDFELLIAVRPRAFPHLAARFTSRFLRTLHPVGRLRAHPGMSFRGEPLERSGWEHFGTNDG